MRKTISLMILWIRLVYENPRIEGDVDHALAQWKLANTTRATLTARIVESRYYIPWLIVMVIIYSCAGVFYIIEALIHRTRYEITNLLSRWKG